MNDVLTSRALALRAIRAHRHLYRLSDCDDPDLGMNVIFAVEQQGLVRLADAEPWPLPDSVLARVVPLVAFAERIVDPRTATECLSGFAHTVLGALERREGHGQGSGAGRRLDDIAPRRTPGCRSGRRDMVVAGRRAVIVGS